MNLINRLTEFVKPFKPLPEGVYHMQSEGVGEKPFRLHLRLQRNGIGVLVINASTVLHLNPTAAEFALHMIKGSNPKDASRAVSGRYRIGKKLALLDYNEFTEKILSLINNPHLDPVSILGLGLVQPNSSDLSAPLRLDCALTYRLPSDADPSFAPVKRVTRELTTSEWQTVMDKAWGVGIPHIVFTGGEATLRDDLVLLISHAEKNGQVAGLLTDGIKLADATYLDTLLKTGLDHLMVLLPIDSEPDWKSLGNMVQADIFLAVHLTVTPANAASVEELIMKIHKIGVENISISVSTPTLKNDAVRLHNCATDLGLRLISDLPVPYSASHPAAFETSEDAEPTGAGKSWLYVEPDGDVLPAQGFADQIMGNILIDNWDKIYLDKK